MSCQAIHASQINRYNRAFWDCLKATFLIFYLIESGVNGLEKMPWVKAFKEIGKSSKELSYIVQELASESQQCPFTLHVTPE